MIEVAYIAGFFKMVFGVLPGPPTFMARGMERVCTKRAPYPIEGLCVEHDLTNASEYGFAKSDWPVLKKRKANS